MAEYPYKLVRYEKSLSSAWHQLVSNAPNSSLLYFRSFMDYHQDRFEDWSYMFYKRNKLLGVFPACKINDSLASHAGLTFGGLCTSNLCSSIDTFNFFKLLINSLEKLNFKSLIYKQKPYFYNKYCADIDSYWLFHFGFRCIESSLSSFIPFSEKLKFSQEKKRHLNKAIQKHLDVKRSEEWGEFWSILEKNLKEKYGKQPVHSLTEILRLKNAFSEDIQLFGVYDANSKLLAGAVLFLSKNVVHLQYISSTDLGKEYSANDLLISKIIQKDWGKRMFFDYGISTENGGAYLNEGLLHHKEGFGLKPTIYNTYELIL